MRLEEVDQDEEVRVNGETPAITTALKIRCAWCANVIVK